MKMKNRPLSSAKTYCQSPEALLEKELAPFRPGSTSELYMKTPPTLTDWG